MHLRLNKPVKIMTCSFKPATILKASHVNHTKTTHTSNLKYCNCLPLMVHGIEPTGMGMGIGLTFLKFRFGSAWPRARAVARTRKVLIVSTIQL